MANIGQLLYQLIFVLFPIFCFYFFLNERFKKHRKVNFTILINSILLLIMSFPVEYTEGYRYDFRLIPVVLSFLYSGLAPGIITVLTLLLYRFYHGGSGFELTLIHYFIATILLSINTSKLKNLQQTKRKLIDVSLIFWIIVLAKIVTLVVIDQINQLSFALIFYFFTWLLLMALLYFIESINHILSIRKKLQQAEKMNVVSQLAASVAHEVRNPMTTVRGFLQLMHSDGKLDQSHSNYIDIALKELDHAQAIINEYLSLARPHTQELSTINISEEVKKTVELMFSYSNIQNISILTSIHDSHYIKGRKDEIKQVLVNLIKNGIESMDNGGTLKINVFENCGIVTIEIIDNGKGMTRKEMNQLGTPFYSTKEKGTGVGLTLCCFQIIQSMKGTIAVESELGQGSKFTIQLPEYHTYSE
ncbi:sensor histidine kinase [Bacillus sp. V5-8f]|uniref:ATP-binding protein n=1 Tax=Bacillus sp. V5-8f TaxID=2053044 RepID=UPI000C782974|nr:sensor histidine kinase [Bacillus sp. V5-8f]PLT32055.1 sporulation kinase [Bacillus sp. V5-8f]